MSASIITHYTWFLWYVAEIVRLVSSKLLKTILMLIGLNIVTIRSTSDGSVSWELLILKCCTTQLRVAFLYLDTSLHGCCTFLRYRFNCVHSFVIIIFLIQTNIWVHMSYHLVCISTVHLTHYTISILMTTLIGLNWIWVLSFDLPIRSMNLIWWPLLNYWLTLLVVAVVTFFQEWRLASDLLSIEVVLLG